MLPCLQSIASRIREPEHAIPPIVDQVKDQIKGQQTLDGSAAKKDSSSGPNDRQQRLINKIVSEGLEKVHRRPIDKQAAITSGTPIEVRHDVSWSVQQGPFESDDEKWQIQIFTERLTCQSYYWNAHL